MKDTKIDNRKRRVRLAAMLGAAALLLFVCTGIAFAGTEAVDSGSVFGSDSKTRGAILFLIVLLLGTVSVHMKKK